MLLSFAFTKCEHHELYNSAHLDKCAQNLPFKIITVLSTLQFSLDLTKMYFCIILLLQLSAGKANKRLPKLLNCSFNKHAVVIFGSVTSLSASCSFDVSSSTLMSNSRLFSHRSPPDVVSSAALLR